MTIDVATLARLAKAPAQSARNPILRPSQASPGRIGGRIAAAVGLGRATLSGRLRCLVAADRLAGEFGGRRVRIAPTPAAVRPPLRKPEAPGPTSGGPCRGPAARGAA